jgi:hypothetical protein
MTDKPIAAADLARRRAQRADTTTPLRSAVPIEPLPDTLPDARRPAEPREDKAARKIVISTTVEHRGRQFTIATEGLTLDQICDLLDERGYVPPTPASWQTLPDGTPLCPKHRAPMKLREKQGDQWYSHNVGTKDAPVYCRGYHGKDSPGYEH